MSSQRLESHSYVMGGMRWIVSSCQAVPALPHCLLSLGALQSRLPSVPLCGTQEGVAAALTAKLQTPFWVNHQLQTELPGVTDGLPPLHQLRHQEKQAPVQAETALVPLSRLQRASQLLHIMGIYSCFWLLCL